MEKVNTTWESFAAGAKQFLNDVVFQYGILCVVLSNQSTERARKNIFAPSFDMAVWQW
jgi:hypothetical protein